SVSPAIQNNPRNVSRRIEARCGKHIAELPPNAALIPTERSRNHLAAPAMSLIFRAQARIRVQNFERKNHRRIGTDGFGNVANRRKAAQLEVVADASAKPATSRNSQFRQWAPIP